MLKPLLYEEFDRYCDFAYALALDPVRSGYPTYTSRPERILWDDKAKRHTMRLSIPERHNR